MLQLFYLNTTKCLFLSLIADSFMAQNIEITITTLIVSPTKYQQLLVSIKSDYLTKWGCLAEPSWLQVLPGENSANTSYTKFLTEDLHARNVHVFTDSLLKRCTSLSVNVLFSCFLVQEMIIFKVSLVYLVGIVLLWTPILSANTVWINDALFVNLCTHN